MVKLYQTISIARAEVPMKHVVQGFNLAATGP